MRLKHPPQRFAARFDQPVPQHDAQRRIGLGLGDQMTQDRSAGAVGGACGAQEGQEIPGPDRLLLHAIDARAGFLRKSVENDRGLAGPPAVERLLSRPCRLGDRFGGHGGITALQSLPKGGVENGLAARDAARPPRRPFCPLIHRATIGEYYETASSVIYRDLRFTNRNEQNGAVATPKTRTSRRLPPPMPEMGAGSPEAGK